MTSQQHGRSAEPTNITLITAPGRAKIVRPAPASAIPAEVVRIGTMASMLLEEARQRPLDEPGRKRLEEIYQISTRELAALLPATLAAELDRFALPFAHQPPTQAELRVAQAQLLGWLEGLFRGIHLNLFTRQMAGDRQLEETRQGDAQPPHDKPVPNPDSYL